MAFRVFRFRRFSTQLLLLLAGLFAVVLGVVYLLIAHFNRVNATESIAADLRQGARFYREAVAVRIEVLARSGSQMANDYAFRQMMVQQDNPDVQTIRSALLNAAGRIGAPVLALFTLEGDLIANTREDLTGEHCGPFRHLITKVGESETGLVDNRYASDFAYLDGQLHVLVIVPLNAPETVNWFGLAFPIDDAFAQKIKSLADLEITFLSGPEHGRRRVLASTLDPAMAADLAGDEHVAMPGQNREMVLRGEPYETTFEPLELLADAPAEIALQRSLNSELASARVLEGIVLIIALAALATATIAALWIARGVSQPVQRLAAHTKLVAAGDYTQSITLPREDELGQLASAFNHMTAGLAERDRVRNLLGMVVSPEIATQLLHSDLKLGGEEREVTVLFCDLRDFTSFSEKMLPTEVLTLLNRYLDRMSGIIEQHGGVIDKFIGDAIMALFGAPVAMPDAAARAVAAARDMVRALEGLNAELRAEGKPILAFGIGINTARVVAGNMGSKTRLNYTVIGDGVNLASRLEGLTKDPAYATPIIASEATLAAINPRPTARELGEVKVKGKAEAVRIFALDADRAV